MLQLYENLKILKLKNMNFEWIMVDDFSDDAGKTSSTMKIISHQKILDVKCIFLTQNYYGSKSVSEGLKIASGEYVIILDQDDTVPGDVFFIFEKYIKKYSENADFAGVCGRCVNSNGEIIGRPFEKNETYANELVIRHVNRHRGEMFQCTKASILKKYFHEMRPGFTNGYVWARISQKYSFVYVNEVVRFYNTQNVNSQTNQRKILFVGNVYRQMFEYLNNNLSYLLSDPLQLLRFSIHCMRYKYHSIFCGQKELSTNSFLLKVIFAISTPIAYFIVKIDRRRNRVFCGRAT